jgi:hypothetical protein
LKEFNIGGEGVDVRDAWNKILHMKIKPKLIVKEWLIFQYSCAE